MSPVKGMKIAYLSLGCKVNAYETDVMKGLLTLRGGITVPFEEAADIYVINTCSVTNMADRKSRQMLHRAKARSKDAIVVAVGCYVQSAGEELIKDGAVDIIIGNNMKNEIVNCIEAYIEKRQSINLSSQLREKHYEELMLGRNAGTAENAEDNGMVAAEKNAENAGNAENESLTGERVRAYVKIQDGCNQFCSYCIIPFVRGRIRSRRSEDILAEVKGLVAEGYKEIVLTGIHLSSYGMEDYEKNRRDDNSMEENASEKPENGGTTPLTVFDHSPLLMVIKKLNELEGLERIRLGSLEPRIITEEFTGELIKCEKVCPHFHLSLQSGSNTVLKRMNRHYTAEEYLESCRILRKYYVSPHIATDIIVGFPGETEEEFEECLAFAKKVNFASLHVFKYSRRKGTRADRMPDQVPDSVKSKRSNRLIAAGEEMSKAYRNELKGLKQKILIEENLEQNGKTLSTGHSERYVKYDLTGGLEINSIAEI